MKQKANVQQLEEARLLLNDEWANTLTHGIGFFLSVIGFIFLIFVPLNMGDHWKLVTFAIYGLSLVGLYGASTLYHGCRDMHLKRTFRMIDHCAIYFLIAGSYTPFTLISLKGVWGWILFSLIWGLALLGVLFKMCFVNRFRMFSTCIYVFMGWLVLIAYEPLTTSLPAEALGWLLAGGLLYTGGVIFFVFDNIRFYHMVWHLFVMAGSFCHYLAVILYV